MAVKVTLVPAQIVFPGFATIETEGIIGVVTVIVIVFDPAPVGLAQVALLVMAQVTKSPLTRAALV